MESCSGNVALPRNTYFTSQFGAFVGGTLGGPTHFLSAPLTLIWLAIVVSGARWISRENVGSLQPA